MRWKIEPSTTKNVVEFITYENDAGDYIVHASHYRWCEIIVESKKKPYYDYSEDGTKFEGCDNELYDCYASSVVEFSEGMSDSAKQEIIDFIEDYGVDELEDVMGWVLTDSVIRIYGPLQISR